MSDNKPTSQIDTSDSKPKQVNESPVRTSNDYRQLASDLHQQHREVLTQRQNMAGKLDGLVDADEDVEGTVTQLQLEMAFDDRLKDLASVKKDHVQDVTPQLRRKFYLARQVLTFFYFIVVPFCQSPAWCLDSYRQAGERNFGTLDCNAVSEATGIRFSAFPTLSPALVVLIDVFCLVVLNVMACYENKWRNQSNGEKTRTGLMIVASCISLIDLVRCFFAMKSPYIGNLMRVPVLFSFAPALAKSFKSLFLDLKDSFAILTTIFTYILLFTLTVYYFYRPMNEGITNFGTLRDAYKQMTILFTTANYPDIFLPAMNVNYFHCFFFMFFMLMGLYFLTNLLLANVFNKYQNRLNEKRDSRRNNRQKYLQIIYEKYDKDANGSFDERECKQFLGDCFDLDYSKEFHRDTARKIMDICEATEESDSFRKVYPCRNLQQFFGLKNFIDIAGLEHLESLHAMAQAAEGEEEYWPMSPREKSFFDGWTQVVLIALNLGITLMFILNDQFQDASQERSGFWRTASVPFTAVFAVESAMVIFATDGATLLAEKKVYILEIICQVCSILGYVYMFTESSGEKIAQGASLLCFAFILRNLRICSLLEEVREFKTIMNVINRLTGPILTQLACLYIVFYIFSIIGIYGLGGLIKQPHFHSEDGIPNNLYYLVNFNDLGMSIHTLYAFMIINNWPAMTDMMVNAAGEVWPRIYFMIFYVIVQWIILNIVVAMMLDVFTSVEKELDTEVDRLINIKKLQAKKAKLGDEDQFRHFCNRVNEKILKEEVEKNKMQQKVLEANQKGIETHIQ